MNKYLSIFKTSVKQEQKTLSNSIVACVSFVVIIYVFYQLWGYIYGSGAGTIVNGYNLKMMIWYMIMAEVLMYSVNARKTTRSFSNDIKSGKIAYHLNKPYNFYFYMIANSMGEFIWKLLLLVPTALLTGLVLLGGIDNFQFVYIIPIMFSLVFAVFLTGVIYGGVGLLAFWIEDSTPFAWIIQKFQMLFGLFFPPEFFPVWLQPIIMYSPVYAMMSGPCKLLASFSWELFFNVCISQVVWTIVFFSLSIIIYKSGTKKVNINGG